MAVISELHIYPVKSCGGIALQHATLTPWGLAATQGDAIGDRAWMVVDAAGRFMSQRKLPRMALIQPCLNEQGTLSVRAPGMPDLPLWPAPTSDVLPPRQVIIWQDLLPAWDAGPTAAQWFSDFLGAEVYLVRFDPSIRRASCNSWTGDQEALNRFSDGFPILVTGQASLEDLNTRLAAKGAPAVPMNRFRPNIVLAGLPAFGEDRLASLTIQAEQPVTLKLVKPCSRCPIPTIDQLSGECHPEWPREPNETLAGFHRSALLNGAVTFGVNAITLRGQGQGLRVGQTVFCTQST